MPWLGLLEAAEMGADLSLLALIPKPGRAPLNVIAVLLDGLDLVVLNLAGMTVTPSRSRALIARVRSHGCTLIITRGAWPGADFRLESTSTAVSGLGRGHGRVQSVGIDVRLSGKGIRSRIEHLTLAGNGQGHTSWTLKPAAITREIRTG